jgi:hypothetical protein
MGKCKKSFNFKRKEIESLKINDEKILEYLEK